MCTLRCCSSIKLPTTRICDWTQPLKTPENLISNSDYFSVPWNIFVIKYAPIKVKNVGGKTPHNGTVVWSNDRFRFKCCYILGDFNYNWAHSAETSESPGIHTFRNLSCEQNQSLVLVLVKTQGHIQALTVTSKHCLVWGVTSQKCWEPPLWMFTSYTVYKCTSRYCVGFLMSYFLQTELRKACLYLLLIDERVKYS